VVRDPLVPGKVRRVIELTPSAFIDAHAVAFCQCFDGPDLADAWMRSARPDAFEGATPWQMVQAGRGGEVVALLEHLSRGG